MLPIFGGSWKGEIMKREWIDGPVSFPHARDRWQLVQKVAYDDYYANPDSEIYSDVLRAQWIMTSGLIATLDYYVRKDDNGGAEEQWKVVERVHFYDPDEGFHQLTEKYFQHDFYPATKENLARAEGRCRVLLDSRDNSHLSEWWELWSQEL